MTEPDVSSFALIPITKETRQRLRSEIKRTAVTVLMMFKTPADLPDGLTTAHVNRWIAGFIKEAPQFHIDYVLGRFAELPDNAGYVSDGSALPKRGKRYADASNRIPLTTDMAGAFRSELARAGRDHATLLDNVSGIRRHAPNTYADEANALQSNYAKLIVSARGETERSITVWQYRQAKAALVIEIARQISTAGE